ncbi:MAG: DNA-deoxyinosine glycosylase [Phascolarctobacterium sp.]|nr:DNA-deoxyinosine glycosylase [Phascolarctobacterium sp.]
MAVIPIFIPHAGCPHQCVFCNQKAISGEARATFNGAKRQIEKWLSFIKPSKGNEAAFYGGSFTGLAPDLQEKLLSLTDDLLKTGTVGSVRISTRPDYIDEKRLTLLSRHGVRLVELGVQSLDNDVLKMAERGHTAEQTGNAVKLLKKKGFETGLQLMVGLPGQSFESVKITAKKAAALKPDVARIYPVLVLKGTPLAGKLKKGDYQPLNIDDAVRQSSYLYKELTKAGVKVIRVGLQPDSELCAEGNIIAGPFHPAMGELVQSFLLREKITPRIKKVKGDALVCFPADMESKVRGLKNSNVAFWRDTFRNKKVILKKGNYKKIIVKSLPENNVAVQVAGCESFAPVAGKNSRVLILGSIPGRTSLAMQQYYAHPRNRFWKVLSLLFKEVVPENYEGKITFLEERNIALWDVISQCDREGSLDNNIKNEQPNDIAGLIKKLPKLRAVFCNGGKAGAAFKKYFEGNIPAGIKVYYMHSTSPANAGMDLEALYNEWRIVKSFLKC